MVLCRAPTMGVGRTHGTGVWAFERRGFHTNKLLQYILNKYRDQDLVLYQGQNMMWGAWSSEHFHILTPLRSLLKNLKLIIIY